MDYPKYLTYKKRNVIPSVLNQNFPLPALSHGEVYYTKDELLSKTFYSEKQSQMFGAAQFCSFLSDTIDVEHSLVIPAIASLRRIPYKIPDEPRQNLYQIATDEGFHAEQSNLFLYELINHFGFEDFTYKRPLFLSKLEERISKEDCEIKKNLIRIINGIVTETRISVELSKFAQNSELSDSIREICRSHAEDENFHSSQFQALGRWLWEEFNEDYKVFASQVLVESSINRSIPDVLKIAKLYRDVSGRTDKDSLEKILVRYNPDYLIRELLFVANPTFVYIKRLGVENYLSIEDKIEEERLQLIKMIEQLSKKT